MINAIDLSRFRNSEFIQFCNNVATLVITNNPSEFSFRTQYDAFKAKVEEAETLFKNSTASAITPEIEELDRRRDRAFTGMSFVIDGFAYHFDAERSHAAITLQNNLKLYGSGITKENYQSQTAIINNLIADWENKPELNQAATLLNLTDWMEELSIANQTLDAKFLERTQEYSDASPDTLKGKRTECTQAYYDLRKFIEAYATIAPSPEYDKTVSDLNALIGQYNNLLNDRSSKSNPNEAPASMN